MSATLSTSELECSHSRSRFGLGLSAPRGRSGASQAIAALGNGLSWWRERRERAWLPRRWPRLPRRGVSAWWAGDNLAEALRCQVVGGACLRGGSGQEPALVLRLRQEPVLGGAEPRR